MIVCCNVNLCVVKVFVYREADVEIQTGLSIANPALHSLLRNPQFVRPSSFIIVPQKKSNVNIYNITKMCYNMISKVTLPTGGLPK